jgi:hypothetical protein
MSKGIRMRTYPRNSPRAAARIVALTMLADGNLCQTELDALERLGAAGRFGLTAPELRAVVQELCEDLLSGSHHAWTSTCTIDPPTLAALVAEVDDPSLQADIVRMCAAVAAADAHNATGEAIVMDALAEHWRMPATISPPPSGPLQPTPA